MADQREQSQQALTSESNVSVDGVMLDAVDGMAAVRTEFTGDTATDSAPIVQGLSPQNKPPASTKTHIVRGVLFSVLGGICWGFSAMCAEFMTGDMGVPVMWITPFRLSAAAFIFLIVCMLREPGNVIAAIRDIRSMVFIVAFAVFGILFSQVSYLNAIAYTNAGTGAVLERTGLVLIMLYVCLRNKRFPRFREFLGLILAIVGTVFIATQGNLTSLAIAPEGLGWGLLTALSLALYTLLPDKPLAKWGSLIVTGIAMFVAAIVALIAMRPWEILVEPNAALLLALTGIILVGTVGAYLFYLQGIADAGPMRAGLVSCIEPVAATIFSAVWLGTSFSLADVIGCALIVLMVILVTERDADAEKRPPELYDGARGDIPVFQGVANELGSYDARLATKADVRAMKHLLEGGRRTMRRLGIKEGMKKYPSARRLQRAIDAGAVYVVETQEYGSPDADQRIIGMFGIDPDGDPAYDKCKGLTWITEGTGNYAALHWVNVEPVCRRRGVGAYILGVAEDIAKEHGALSICCDVYEANTPIRNLLTQEGYGICGTITLRDWKGNYSKRLLYEKIF